MSMLDLLRSVYIFENLIRLPETNTNISFFHMVSTQNITRVPRAETRFSPGRFAILLLSVWRTGASGFIASTGSNTAGNDSYSTSIRSNASSAISRPSAATAAITSPTYLTRSIATTG